MQLSQFYKEEVFEMENNNRRKLGTYQICLIALAIVMNVIGGQIALALRLPIYLDSIGTIMIAASLTVLI